MLVNFTQISVHVPCTPDEGLLLAAAIDGDHDESTMPEQVVAFLCEHSFTGHSEDCWTGADTKIEAEGVRIWAEEDVEVEIVAAAIQRFAPSALPFGFTFGVTTSALCHNAYSGGFILVRSDDIDVSSADEVLHAALDDDRGKAFPSVSPKRACPTDTPTDQSQ